MLRMATSRFIVTLAFAGLFAGGIALDPCHGCNFTSSFTALFGSFPGTEITYAPHLVITLSERPTGDGICVGIKPEYTGSPCIFWGELVVDVGVGQPTPLDVNFAELDLTTVAPGGSSILPFPAPTFFPCTGSGFSVELEPNLPEPPDQPAVGVWNCVCSTCC